MDRPTPAAPDLWDPLGHAQPLPLVERFSPLGFPLVLRTNSSHVLDAAGLGWGEFAETFQTAPIELRVVVNEQEAQPPPATAEGPVFRSQGHLLALVLGTENFAVCDLDRCFGFACLTPAVAQDPLFTSFYFLDGMAYPCLSQRYLTPIHAACVARNGGGILLVGRSGAGKSSLAWACARAGLTYVADDATWLLRNGSEPVLIGKPQRMRFRPEIFELLPELARAPRIETVIGKRSFEIRTADVPGLTTANRCRPWKIVFLDRRREGPAEMSRVEPEQARRRLEQARNLCEPRVWKEQEASVEQLLGVGSLVLRYSSLPAAVEQILKLE